MEWRVEKNKNLALFYLQGDIDRREDTQILKNVIRQCLDEKIIFFGFNLSQVSYFDSGAVNLFHFCHKQIVPFNGKIGFIGFNYHLTESMKLIGLQAIGTFYISDEDFVSEVKAKEKSAVH